MAENSLELMRLLIDESLPMQLRKLDEPDNYIALPELQPWLAELEDDCGDTLPQTILISHHPEAIDFLSDKAVWLGREPESHTRILDVKNDTMLKVSELYAQGLAP